MVLPTDPLPPEPDPAPRPEPSGQLRQIEDQATRDLQTWRERREALRKQREGGDLAGEDAPADEGGARRRNLFRPPPWMK